MKLFLFSRPPHEILARTFGLMTDSRMRLSWEIFLMGTSSPEKFSPGDSHENIWHHLENSLPQKNENENSVVMREKTERFMRRLVRAPSDVSQCLTRLS